MERFHTLLFGANALEIHAEVAAARMLSTVGSVEARLRSEEDAHPTNDIRFLAWEMWEQRADVARKLLEHDEELSTTIVAPLSSSEVQAGMSIADANKHPAFEHCHFTEECRDDDSLSTESKRLKMEHKPSKTLDSAQPPASFNPQQPSHDPRSLDGALGAQNSVPSERFNPSNNSRPHDVAQRDPRPQGFSTTPDCPPGRQPQPHQAQPTLSMHQGQARSACFNSKPAWQQNTAPSEPRDRQAPHHATEEDHDASHTTGPFKSANVQYQIDMAKKGAGRNQGSSQHQGTGRFGSRSSGNQQGSGGLSATGGARTNGLKRGKPLHGPRGGAQQQQQDQPPAKEESELPEELIDHPELKNIESKMIELILNEVLDKNPGVKWDDIAGLEYAKDVMNEVVVFPMQRPDIFTGLRAPPKGILLFGPPGTGKTMIGKAIASETGAKFFSVSASSLMSKWIGEGEKMVRALFSVARCYPPAVVFVDEIDSLLTTRSDGEQEATRRVKTEFLVQIDGAGVSQDSRVLLVGATNLPDQLDEAARRRMAKRIFIPLPDEEGRKQLVIRQMTEKGTDSMLSESDVATIVAKAEGYSGSDLQNLCAEAAMGPVRESMKKGSIKYMNKSDIRPVQI